MDPDQPTNRAGKALRRPVFLTRLGMVAERLTRAFWPFWSVALGICAFVFFGVHESSRIELVWVGVVLSLAALFWTAWRGVNVFAWPSRDEAVARLDASLPGRPIQTLSDTQVVGASDAASVAVWRAHVARMAAKLDNVAPVAGDLELASRDPFALRYVAVTVFAVALLFGSVLRVSTLGEVAGQSGANSLAAGPSWEGWVEPPAYTGKPSLYLNDITTADLAVPFGSRISLRLYGEVGALTVSETVSGRTDGIEPASSPTHQFDVTQSGRISIDGEGGQSWVVTVEADQPPVVMLDGDLEREAAGQMKQGYTAQDDFGVIAGNGIFELDMARMDRRYGLSVAPDPRAPIEIDLPMPIAGGRTDFTETIVEDFSKHPWSGLPVLLTLTVRDEADQTGTSEPQEILLPGRRFFEPMAAALIEQRRDLLWARANGARVAQILRTVSYRPDDIFRDPSSYLQLRVALKRLELSVETGLTAQVQDEVAEALWTIALGLEEGDLSDALERLRRAQDRLSEAIKNGANDEEIAQLMQEMRDALQEYMRQLAQQQDPNQQDQQQAQNQMEMSGNQLEEMLQRLQELMEQGRMAEAQQLLDQLRQMMENMQVTQGQQGQGGQSPGQQAMEGLAETLRDQQGLSDESFRDLQEQFNPDAQSGQSQQNQGRNGSEGQGESHEQGQQQGQGQGGGSQGQGAENNEESLAQRQGDLRRELQRQQNNLPGAGTEEGEAARRSLGEAGEAMDRAEQDLNDGNLSGAINNQAQAMESLREGMRNLGEALAQEQQQGGQQGQAMNGNNNPSSRRDPLGRARGADGALGSEENLLQGEDVYRRARDLLDEIRRRSGEQDRPAIELEYLRRLLDRF